jgi:hypothetical protein
MSDEAERQRIVSRFIEMRSDLASVSGRLADLAAEEGEHARVVAALEPMAADRRCWRLVSGELVLDGVCVHPSRAQGLLRGKVLARMWDAVVCGCARGGAFFTFFCALMRGEATRPAARSPLLNPLPSPPLFFSQVGDVLVERTVGEVLPAVQSNQAQLAEVRSDVVGWLLVFLPFSSILHPFSHHLSPPKRQHTKTSKQIVKKLRADAKAKEEALLEYQQKHGIRVRDEPPPPPPPPAKAAAGGGGGGGSGEGVLV